MTFWSEMMSEYVLIGPLFDFTLKLLLLNLLKWSKRSDFMSQVCSCPEHTVLMD